MKKSMMRLCMLLMLISALWFVGTEKSQVLAAGNDAFITKELSGVEITDNMQAPQEEGYIFAGYYEETTCETPVKATTDKTVYAKFVPNSILSVKAQLKADATKESTSTNLRLVSSVDSLNYKNVGFEVYYNNATKPVIVKSTKVYQRIVASAESSVDYNYSPKVMDVESEYFITATLVNINKANFDKGFYIKPYWQTLDGTTVYGEGKYLTVNNGLDENNINLAVKVPAALNAETMTVKVGETTYPATLAYYDASTGYAYINVTVENKVEVLPSLSAVTISDGTTSVATKYRNLLTTYEGTADTSWYDADATKLVIATAADLYGFSELSESNTFKGKTVYVICDITANSGSWSELKSKIEDSDTTNDPYKWIQVCKNESTPFEGIFDGQGHTISGLYVNGSSARQGMFGYVSGATVTNFRLLNTYIKSSIGSDKIGAVVSTTKGKTEVSNIYTNATLNNTKNDRWTGTGGIVGLVNDGSATISNCYFDGTIISAGVNTGGIVGCAGSSEGTLTIIAHCLNGGSITNSFSSASYASRTGGLCGGVISKNTVLTIEDSLAIGNITMNGNKDGGAIVGLVGLASSAGASVQGLNNSTYAILKGDVTSVVGSIDTKYGSVNGLDNETVVATNLVGYKGLDAQNLDFENYWAVRANDVPVLKTFADEKVCDIDTSWYDDNKTTFEIKNKEQLMGLSYLSQTNNFEGKTIKLVADINFNTNAPSTQAGWDTYVQKNKVNEWIAIGNSTTPFKGTFDGKGHTISGLYAKTTVEKNALFGDVRDGAVGNFRVENSYFESSAYYVSGAVAYAQNSTISNIYSNAVVVSTNTEEQARAAGILSQGDTGTVTISNCWFDGTVTSAGGFNGGIVGRASVVTMNLSHCLNTGTVSSTFTGKNKYTGGIIGGINNANTSIISVSDTLSAGTLKLTGTIASSGTAFGFIGYNAKVTASEVYANTNKAIIDGVETTHVTNTGNPDTGSIADLTGSDITGFKALNLLALDYGQIWTVRKDNIPALLQFAKEDVLLDARWYNETDKEFVIDTAAELYGLAYMSKTNDFAGKTIKLGADIIVNKGTPDTLENWETYLADADLVDWMTIGSSAKPFAGTFDGQGHTISGVYHDTDASNQGLFGVVNGARIEDFRLENSYFATSGSIQGSIVGQVQNSTISKVYSNAVVVGTLATSWSRSSGMFGQADQGTVNISECWYDGTVKTAGGRTAGILGWGSVQINMSNCLNTGTLISTHSSSDEYTGGLIGGFTNDTKTKGNISDCMNAGTLILNGSTGLVGTAFGHLAWDSSVTVNNVYTTTNKAILSGAETTLKVMYNTDVIDKGNGIKDYTGYNMNGTYGYSLTALDFEEKWTIVEDGTPILKAFAEEVPSLAGVPRYDLTWYDSTKTSFTISSAEQLHALSYLVETGIDTFVSNTITLGADIEVNVDAPNTQEAWATYVNENTIRWTPIGASSKQFAGTFDGQGHTIRGLYTKVTAAASIGLFGSITKNVTIQNVRVENSYFENVGNVWGANTGAIVGFSQGVTMHNVYSNAVITTTETVSATNGGSYMGGLVGLNRNATTTVTSSWFSGVVNGSNKYAGGIIGGCYDATSGGLIENCLFDGQLMGNVPDGAGGITGFATKNTTISSCLSAGTNTCSGISGSLVGNTPWGDRDTVTAPNTYATKECCANIINTSRPLKGATQVDSANILGEWAKTGAPNLDYASIWMCVENSTPVLKVFYSMLPDTAWFDNAEEGATEYTISTANELYGLAKLSVTENFAGKTIHLAKDIKLNESGSTKYQWVTPIGAVDNPFAGTFDGQGHTIKGIYLNTSTANQGLFGTTSQATIKNLSLKDSHFESSASTLGSIVGYAQNTIISGVYSNATVIGKYVGNDAQVGGFVGKATTTAVTLEECWFDGTVQAKGGREAAFVAYAEKVTLTMQNCLNSGVVENSYTVDNTYAGGMLGGMENQNTSILNISDCLNAGVLKLNGNTNITGTAIGHPSWNAKVTLTNFYATTSNAIINGVETAHKLVYADGALDQCTIVNLTGISINGADALKNASGLDYDGYWMMVEGKTPVLKTFYGMTPDTAWFDNAEEGATEYIISTANELYGLAKLSVTESFAEKTIYLANDIELNKSGDTKYQWVTPIGTESKPFAGTFDGQGNTISGIYIDSLRGKQGLFGSLAGTVQNVTLEDGSIKSASTQNGTIAGTASGTIQNVYSNIDLVSTSASGYDHNGGFVGLVSSTLAINNCWFDGSVEVAGRGVGGFVGTISGAKATLDVAHCLNAGEISSSYASSRTGGICGQVLNATVTITDTLSAGHLSFSTNEYQVGAVVGVVDQGVTNGTGNVTLSNVFSTQESFVKPTSQTLEGDRYLGISGVFHQVSEADRFVGYFSDYSAFKFGDKYATDAALDYNNYWALSKTGTPVLKTFAPSESLYDITSVDEELFLTTWNNSDVTVTNAKDAGGSVYQIAIEDESEYVAYVETLKNAGFTCIENTIDGMYNAICAKGEWTVTVIHAAGNVNKTYISFSTAQTLSDALSVENADQTVKEEGAQNKLHMLQQEIDGNSMVLELKNGHFVVYDGGKGEELESLMSYLKKLAGTKDGKQNQVIIDAWVISHFHSDHVDALSDIRHCLTDANVREWVKDVKVEAIYVNEPNDFVKEYSSGSNGIIKKVSDVYNAIRFLETTEGNTPNVYRMQAGQKYYFGDITMDVVFSQELATSSEMYIEDFGDERSCDFNDTSTWLMFNVDGEKVFLSADGNIANMNYLMDVYSKEYLTVDVFQAPHHGANTIGNFTNYCTVNDFVLFESTYNPTSFTNWTGTNNEGEQKYSYTLINENRKLVGLETETDTTALAWAGISSKLYTYDTTPTIPYFYLNGKHTILTFTGTGISGTQVEQ